MNSNSRSTIEGEVRGHKHILDTLETDDIDEFRECLQEIADDVHCNARWGNVANVYVDFKNSIREALTLYQMNDIDAVGALRTIADALSQAQNDERDGLLLIEKEFGFVNEPGSTHQAEERLRATSGTTDWKKLNKTRFSRVYGK